MHSEELSGARLVNRNNKPKLSIGLPVFNGEDSVRRALESLLAQTFKDFLLIISDNASTDGTEDICRSFIKADPRIVYYRQEFNKGAAENFDFVRQSAKTQYFMWAAADDYWEADFVEKMIGGLEADSDAVAYMSEVYLDGCVYDRERAGTLPLVGDFNARLQRFVCSPGANSRFYSVYRLESIKDIKIRNCLASDWIFIVDVLSKGQLKTVDGYYGFRKSLQGSGVGVKRLLTFRRSFVERMIPYYRFSVHVLRAKLSFELLVCLARLNALAFLEIVAEKDSTK